MNEVMIGILVPFLGTSLGSACVFFMKKNMSDYLQRALTGFAAGVMVERFDPLIVLASIHKESCTALYGVPTKIGRAHV